MNTKESLRFQTICTVYDEFRKQSKGRLVISKATEFDEATFASLSLTELEVFVNSWVKELRASPEFYFYRGNFFWRVFVEEESLCAELVEKHTKGNSPIGKTLKWSVKTLNPERVVKNLLDIMRSHERALRGKRKVTSKKALSV